jgi:hypothetical protein
LHLESWLAMVWHLACAVLLSCCLGVSVVLASRLSGRLGVLIAPISVVFAFPRHAVLLSWCLGVLRAALLSCPLGSPQWLNRMHLDV